MNTQTTITADTAAEIIEYVPLADLYLSDLNRVRTFPMKALPYWLTALWPAA